MPKKQAEQYDAKRFNEIKVRAAQIVQNYAKTKQMDKDLADMFWIHEDNAVKVSSSYDLSDIRYTKSPSARNEAIGLHRLLKTSKPTFHIDSDNDAWSTKMEKLLEDWWKYNNVKKRAALESDLALSAILFADVNLTVDVVDDLLAIGSLNPIRRKRLETQKLYTPVLFTVEPAQSCYPVFGQDGLSEWLKKWNVRGRAVAERWGVEGLDGNSYYVVYDYYDLEWRCVWLEGRGVPLEMGKHQLPDIPVFSSTADGTELFEEEERRRQPFLYGKWKAHLDQREDELLTLMFTSAYSRGLGPLALLDPASIQGGVVDVNYKGLFRYVTAKGVFADDHAYDRNLLELNQLLQSIGQESTIYQQTLGENIAPGTPYSGYAAASQNGRIAVIPVQEALQKVIGDAGCYCIDRIKWSGLTWGSGDREVSASEVPDQYKLTVKLEVDLPQDQMRNAQVVAQLKGSGVTLTDEFIHDKFLQIHDSEQMAFDAMAEQAMKEAFKADLPKLIEQMTQMLMPQPEQPPGGPSPDQTSGGPPVPPEMQQQPGPAEQGMAPQMVGGPQAAQAGGEVMPQQQPQQPGGPGNGRY